MATKLILFGGLPVLSEGTPVVFTPAPAEPVAAVDNNTWEPGVYGWEIFTT